MITLTDEQKRAVDYLGNMLLTACPGSGKTRVILAKLLKVSDEVVGTPQFVGCITYTNAAVDEIEFRLRRYGSNASAEKCYIATIHSFCLHYILRPYHWLMPEVPPNFKVLTKEMSVFEAIVRAVEDEVSRPVKFQTFEDYGSLRIDLEGNPCGQGFESGIVSDATARRYWELVLNRGYLDFSQILYYSWKVLSKNEFVGRGIASRFKWLLVDEFQDTTDIQVEIFQELRKHLHTYFLLVGDKNQSIMRFAGARPELAQIFAEDIHAKLDVSLSGNFRSAPQIITPSETLLPTEPPMHSVGDAKEVTGYVNHVHVQQPVNAITDYFLPSLQDIGIPLGRAAILAPWWTHLIPIARHLRQLDVPVFGPGARPYKKKRLFAQLAEQLGACAEADDLLGLPGVERALFRLVNDVTGNTRFDVFSYAGRRSALAMIYESIKISESTPSGAKWLQETSEVVSTILISDGWLPESSRNLLSDSAQEMIADMQANDVDVANLLVSDLGLFANPDQALKLTTLHNSKGREFDAVAMVCMNAGSIPHYLERTQEGFDEARRLFYVGMTRAKKVLLIASDQSHWRNRPTPFIEESGL